MRCRCGNEITHVPEHLRELANWVCQQCTNAAPKSSSFAVEHEEQSRKPMQFGRKRKAA